MPSRLEVARAQGAEAINFDAVNPVHALMELTRGIGPDRVIEAVGVDAQSPQAEANVISAVGADLIGIQEEKGTIAAMANLLGMHHAVLPNAVAEANSASIVDMRTFEGTP